LLIVPQRTLDAGVNRCEDPRQLLAILCLGTLLPQLRHSAAITQLATRAAEESNRGAAFRD
jgi:hypothetical protein